MSLPASSQVFFFHAGNSSPEVHAGPSTLKAEITAFFFFSPRWLQNQLAHIFFFKFKQEISLLICWGLSAGLISVLVAAVSETPPSPRAVLRGSVCSWKKMFKKVIDGERLDAGDLGHGGSGRGRCSLPAWR